MKEPFTLKINQEVDDKVLDCIVDLKKEVIEGTNTFNVDYYDMKRYIPENYYQVIYNY